MKRMSVLAALLLVLGLVAGCGGSSSSGSDTSGGATADGPPTDASVQDFCGAFMDLIQQVSQAGDDITDAQAVKLAKDLADKLSEVGTPSDMPADARRAFETALDKIHAIPDDATRAEMTKAAQDLSEDQKKDQAALSDYITSKCMGELNPSGGASDSGTASGG